ncbi:hypothetical protein QTH90_08850 [Variovorax sp. J2P1-59]|uniref:DUF6895 family protein n=1 Tax=Variovorax flavidus TaxID=3053501 RepID=UPI002575BF85|nr:hypothetical protein [Variovorax sp. J2P1-59]MDM0074488.1 hypothetical protein [Variovorax sp. J2P1-59]
MGQFWDRRDLIRRIYQALDIAGRAVEVVTNRQSRTQAGERASPNLIPREDLELQSRPLIAEKVLTEASMLLRTVVCLRESDTAVAQAVDKLAHRIAPYARSESVMVALCREPAFALDHAAAHIHLVDLGYSNEAIDRLLKEILNGEDTGRPERLPGQDLEHEWLKEVWSGGRMNAETHRDLVARTCMARRIDSLGASSFDLYAFTHVVLHASDMGRHPVQLPRPIAEIEEDADAAVAAAVDADNLDLTAELLWTWPMLGLPWSPVATFGFGVLASAQDELGFVPGPEYSVPNCKLLPPLLHEEYMLRTSYHANIVMGFLCATALQLGRSPPASVAPLAAVSGVIDRITPLLDARTREPRWVAAFSRLDSTQREALSSFALTLALRRAASVHKMSLVRECLRIGLQCGLDDGPAFRQSLALLRRATTLGCLGVGGHQHQTNALA